MMNPADAHPEVMAERAVDHDPLRAALDRVADLTRERDEAIGLLRECVGVENSEDGDDAGLYDLALCAMNPLSGIGAETERDEQLEHFSGIAQERVDRVRDFLAATSARRTTDGRVHNSATGEP